MKLPFIILLTAFMLAAGAYAKSNSDDQKITAVDVDRSTVTVNQHGELKTYHVGTFTGIFINGFKGSIRELSVGMKVTDMSLSDPNTLSGIQTSGKPNPVPAPETKSASVQTEAEVTAILTSSRWHFSGGGWSNVRTFRSDGTFSSKHDSKKDRGWKIVNGMVVLTFSTHEDKIFLPIDQNGGTGVDQKGETMTMSRELEKPKKNDENATASSELQEDASEIVKENSNNLVFVSGKEGEGSGFIASMGGANFLVTNAHVAAGINGATFKVLDGTAVQGGAASVAVGEGVFRIEMPTGGKPLEIMQRVGENASIGDEVVVLGNTEGAGVIKTITGKITGIGPNLVEVNAPFMPGNSGSPIIHIKSGTVIGVASYTVTQKYDAITKEKIKTPVIRRFGYRLDQVKTWQPVNWQTFYTQASKMQEIEALTHDLDDFFRDLAENKGRVTQARHANPVIRNLIDRWLADKARHPSPVDEAAIDTNFISSLKIVSQTDVAAVQRGMSYDYFQRELANQQATRNEMAEAFEEFIKTSRR